MLNYSVLLAQSNAMHCCPLANWRDTRRVVAGLGARQHSSQDCWSFNLASLLQCSKDYKYIDAAQSLMNARCHS